MIFSYDEIDLLTIDQFYRLSKIKLDINDIVNSRDIQSNNQDFSFLDVLELLVSHNEHLLADKLKMCNYKLNRAVFSATSVRKYLQFRYRSSFKFRKLNHIDSELIKINHFFDEPSPILKSYSGCLPALKFFSNGELLLLSDSERNVLSNIKIDMSTQFHVKVCLAHFKFMHAADSTYNHALSAFDFLSVLLVLSMYENENTSKLQVALNYQIVLCNNYSIDRSTFNARSVVEYLAIQNHRSYEFEYLILNIIRKYLRDKF